jgi:hypothetical protein
LKKKLQTAIERRNKAAEKFEEVTHAVPRGVRFPDDRILHASTDYTAAQEAVTAALLAMNNFGINGFTI